MTRRKLLLSAGVAGALSAQTAKKMAAKKGPAKPALLVTLPGGASLSPEKMAGDVRVVEFFKTTCPHCQKSMPLTQRAFKEFGPRGFKVIGVAVDQDPEPLVKDFAKNYGITFPVGWAKIEDICAYLEVKPEQLYVPTMLVLDRKGGVRGKYVGGDPFFNMEEQNLRNLVEMLLKEPRKS